MLKAVNKFIALVIDSVKLMKHGRAWLYLLIIAAFDYLLLHAHYTFYSPLFYAPVTNWVDLVNNEYAIGFTHYPGHLMLLPFFFYRAKLVLGIFIEGLILGGVAMLFYRSMYDLPKEKRRTPGQFLSVWFQLSMAWLILNGLIFLAGSILPELFESLIRNHPRRQMVFDYLLLPSLNVMFFAVMYIVIPYIVVYNTHVFQALKSSIQFFIKNPIFMLFVSGALLLVPTLFSFVLMNQHIIINKFVPDFIYGIIIAGLFMDVVINFLWMGSAVELLVQEE